MLHPFQPTAMLARLSRAGCVLAGSFSLITGERAAGGGFFFCGVGVGAVWHAPMLRWPEAAVMPRNVDGSGLFSSMRGML